MADYTKGGRSKKAPYETTHVRIPVELKLEVQEMSNEYKQEFDKAQQESLGFTDCDISSNKQISARIHKDLYWRFTEKVRKEGKQSGKVIEQLINSYCNDTVSSSSNTLVSNNKDKSKELTKREYFAVMALQGLAANPDPDDLDLPRGAVSLADELIEELNKEEEE